MMARSDPASLAAFLARPRTRGRLTAMLIVSVAIHAVAGALIFSRPQTVEIAGGTQLGATVLGNAFEDALSMGEISETIAPVEQSESAETITPSPVQTALPSDPQSTPPVGATASQPTQAAPSPPTNPLPSAAAPESAPAQSTAPAVVVAPAVSEQPTTPVESPPATAATQPEDQQPTAAAPETAPPRNAQAPVETAEALEPEPDPIADVPLPTPRPEYTPPAPRQAERAPAPQQQAAPRPAQTRSGNQAGNRGNQAADQRRGTADGQASGQSAAAAQRQAAATAAGNAAVSNYPGQIVSRLRRALRYPSAARRERATGEVHVSFSVNANGGVSALRIARSSGYAVLDEAALATVQRAAPFPAIPAGAGRSSWTFSVPLAFSR